MGEASREVDSADGSSAVGSAMGMLSSLTSVVQTTVSRCARAGKSLCGNVSPLKEEEEGKVEQFTFVLAFARQEPRFDSLSSRLKIDLFTGKVSDHWRS